MKATAVWLLTSAASGAFQRMVTVTWRPPAAGVSMATVGGYVVLEGMSALTLSTQFCAGGRADAARHRVARDVVVVRAAVDPDLAEDLVGEEGGFRPVARVRDRAHGDGLHRHEGEHAQGEDEDPDEGLEEHHAFLLAEDSLSWSAAPLEAGARVARGHLGIAHPQRAAAGISI